MGTIGTFLKTIFVLECQRGIRGKNEQFLILNMDDSEK